MSSSVATGLYNALAANADAEIATARATLGIYFSSAVGIGEHPQHIEEMTKLLETIAAAEDRKEALIQYFSEHAPSC